MADNGVSKRPLRVFCSYAHDDHEFQRKLRNHVRQLVRDGVIELWDDRQLKAGQDKWDATIREQLATADVGLFLISSSFTGSDFIVPEELTPILDRAEKGERCWPLGVLVRRVHAVNDLMAGYQVMPQDEAGNLVPIVKWPYEDDAFALVVARLAEIAQECAAATGRESHWVRVPQRSREFVGRRALLERLKTEFAAAGGRPLVALLGDSGIGKTSVAVEYCWSQRDEYDHVVWLRTEQDTRLEVEFVDAAESVAGLPASDQETSKVAFRDWLEKHDRWLFVFDNAVDPEAVQELLPRTWRGHVLVTTREADWRNCARVVPVEALAHEDAVAFLLDITNSHDTAAADRIADATRCVPRALESAVRSVREDGISLADYAARVEASIEHA
jgi:hypothetical protein